MVFKLGLEAQKHWRRLEGFELIRKVVTGVRFVDGEEVDSSSGASPFGRLDLAVGRALINGTEPDVRVSARATAGPVFDISKAADYDGVHCSH
jgi:hypothetical protein